MNQTIIEQSTFTIKDLIAILPSHIFHAKYGTILIKTNNPHVLDFIVSYYLLTGWQIESDRRPDSRIINLSSPIRYDIRFRGVKLRNYNNCFTISFYSKGSTNTFPRGRLYLTLE